MKEHVVFSKWHMHEKGQNEYHLGCSVASRTRERILVANS